MEETKVIYHIDDEEIPYLVKVPIAPERVTLADFKNVLKRHYKPSLSLEYFFKSIDVFGVVKEEIVDDDAHLPCFNGRIVSWVKRSGHDGEEGVPEHQFEGRGSPLKPMNAEKCPSTRADEEDGPPTKRGRAKPKKDGAKPKKDGAKPKVKRSRYDGEEGVSEHQFEGRGSPLKPMNAEKCPSTRADKEDGPPTKRGRAKPKKDGVNSKVNLNKTVMMESLPEEMVVAVAQHLEMKDLFACLMVSHGWRDSFNRDSVWKVRCDVETCEHLEATRSVVEPCFTPPPVPELETLNPLCRWSVNFLRQNHLFNNWRQGRHFTQTIELKKYDNFSFITNDFIVGIKEGNTIAVWNIREMSPYVNEITSTMWYEETRCCSRSLRKVNPVRLLPHWKVDSITALTSNNMVIVQQRLVYIFNVSLTSDQWSLNYMFFINEPEKVTVNSVSDYDDSQIIQGEEDASMRYTIADNHFFVGCIRGEDKFHIWDLMKGEKIKEEQIPVDAEGRLISFKDSKTSRDIVIVTLELSTKPMINFFIYNLTTFLFLTFKVTYDFGGCVESLLRIKQNIHENYEISYIIHGKYVAIRLNRKMEIFDYHTSNCLLTVQQCCFGPQIMKNNFVFNCYGPGTGSSPNIIIYDPAKLHEKVIPVDDTEFLVLNDRFYLCKKVDNSNAEVRILCDSKNVWEIDGKSLEAFNTKTWILCKIASSEEVNKACSRLLMKRQGHYVGHFVGGLLQILDLTTFW